MAIRNIRTKGDEVLRKKCRNVDTINERTLTLIEDMIDTMYDADGVGLAAPQVGILKRIFVIDVYDDYGPRVFINSFNFRSSLLIEFIKKIVLKGG